MYDPPGPGYYGCYLHLYDTLFQPDRLCWLAGHLRGGLLLLDQPVQFD
jgi:hypothetical protein